MIRHVSIACLLLLASVALADPPKVTAPEKLYGEAGDWVEVTVSTDGKQVRFVPLDSGLKVIDPKKLADPKSTMVSASKAKTYRLLAYTGNADGPSDPVMIFITFGQPSNPGVDPVEPVTPVDPLTASLQAAFQLDATPDKDAKVRQLATAMRSAAVTAEDVTLATNGALTNRVKSDSDSAIGAGNLTPVRTEIGKYLAARFPTTSVALSTELRAKFKAEYLNVAKALDAVR